MESHKDYCVKAAEISEIKTKVDAIEKTVARTITKIETVEKTVSKIDDIERIVTKGNGVEPLAKTVPELAFAVKDLVIRLEEYRKVTSGFQQYLQTEEGKQIGVAQMVSRIKDTKSNHQWVVGLLVGIILATIAALITLILKLV